MNRPNPPKTGASSQRLIPQGGAADAERPAWMIEAHDELAIRRPAVDETGEPTPATPQTGAKRGRPIGVAVAMALIFGAGFGAVLLIDRAGTSTANGDDAASVSTVPLDEAEAGSTVEVTTVGTEDEIPDASDLPEGDDKDRMSIRIETPGEAENDADTGDTSTAGGATATIRNDGLLYFEGAFRSAVEADRYVTRAAEVFGADAIVRNYGINPNAPSPEASDVALDKPVLFERGSADIHPDYIPFLEACGDVLKLNPDITMSISAFTDASGSEEFNLELSQRRAQAIVEFYRDLDIADDQLIGTGFGEDAFFGDNKTDAGQSENRRAMLQLLNVMADD
ncbi:MAG: OmpA family protein [Acidimicrobiales bacterium]